MPNEKWYDGALTTDVNVDEVSGACEFREWMNGMFGIREKITNLSVDHSIVLRIGRNPSLFNYEQLRLVILVLIDILRAGFGPKDVILMTTYLHHSIALTTSRNPSLYNNGQLRLAAHVLIDYFENWFRTEGRCFHDGLIATALDDAPYVQNFIRRISLFNSISIIQLL